MRQTREHGSSEEPERPSAFQGIMISPVGASEAEAHRPRISAFIWGGKVRPTPTLPFGRWKGAA